ncbi:MAG: hypothetical protein SNJ72_07705 [Fimbriimonadales bacterium]
MRLGRTLGFALWLIGLVAEIMLVKPKLPIPYALLGLIGVVGFVLVYELLGKRLLARKEDYYA